MIVSVKTNIDQILSPLAKITGQYRFAVALALTRTARQIANGIRFDLEKVFDRPTGFTKIAAYFKAADKNTLTAEVGLKDKQAEYLTWNIKGGIRVPYAKANKLPTGAPVNKFGNIARNYIRRMIEKADRQKVEAKHARKHKGKRRFIVKQTYFYGVPRGKKKRPAGIYLRTRHRGLISLVVFRNQGFKYHTRYDYFTTVRQRFLQVFNSRLPEAWDYAWKTAKLFK